MNVCLRYVTNGSTITCDIGFELLVGATVFALIVIAAVVTVFGQSILKAHRVRRFRRVLTAAGVEPSNVRWFTETFQQSGADYDQSLWSRMRGFDVPENVIRRAHGWKVKP